MIQYKVPDWGEGKWFELKKVERSDTNHELVIQAAKEFMESRWEEFSNIFPTEFILKTEEGREFTFFVDMELEPLFNARLKI